MRKSQLHNPRYAAKRKAKNRVRDRIARKSRQRNR